MAGKRPLTMIFCVKMKSEYPLRGVRFLGVSGASDLDRVTLILRKLFTLCGVLNLRKVTFLGHILCTFG